MAVIADGQIELSVTNRAGKRHVLNVLRSGQLYGLIPMLDGEPLYYGALAITPCTMVTLSRERMVDSMHRSSALTMGVLGLIEQKYSKVSLKNISQLEQLVTNEL